MTFIDRTNSSALQKKKSRAVQENLHVQKFQRYLPQPQMSMAGIFPIPEFNSSYTITDSNLVRIGGKQFFEKYHESGPSIEFSPRKNIH
jgi:hypothetical protein